ncbi:MAG: polysaccharide biosynthesis protein [Oscillospiraceae bacterium]|nr:polysaccharide biosynthesis protein [Oscillospiraceae bacterium]
MTQKHAKQNLLQGAAVLGAAMIIVKILGAAFKIPVFGMLGEVGTAYFNTAYSLFTPLYSLAIAGLPTAVAKIVAECETQGRFRDIKKTMRISTTLFILLGIIGTIALALFAKPFIALSGVDDGAYLATVMIAPSLLFLCLTSAFRGYYEGLRNMKPTAVSEIVEVIVKVIIGLGLTAIVFWNANSQYESTGMVFGQAINFDSNTMKADELTVSIANAAAPYAAVAAIIGVTLSTFAGMIYLIFRYKKHGDGILKDELLLSPKAQRGKRVLKSLVNIAIPISIGAFVLNLATLVDTLTVTNAMTSAFKNNLEEITRLFGNIVPAESFTVDLFGTFMYGAYSFAFSIFNLIPAFTGVFGKSALPNVVYCWTMKDKIGTRKNIESTLRLSSLIAIPAGLGLYALSGPILSLLYSNRSAGVAIAAPAMEIMGISIIFLGILTPTFSILQAIDKAYLPVKLMVVGSIIKIIVNVLLIQIPEINLKGAAYGTLACYLFITVVSIHMVRKITKSKFDYMSMFIKPLVAGGLCAIAASASHTFISRIKPGSLATIAAIAVAGIVYVVVLVLIRGIAKDDVLMLPKGEKIAKTLEKHRLIG